MSALIRAVHYTNDTDQNISGGESGFITATSTGFINTYVKNDSLAVTSATTLNTNLSQINSTAASNFVGSGTTTNSLRFNIATDDLLLAQSKIYPSIGARENTTLMTPICLRGKSAVISNTEWTSVAYSSSAMAYPRFGMNKNKTLSLISTSANDTNTTGSHAWIVTVEGYNSSTGALITETVNLNGTSAVNTSNSFFGIRRIYCSTWGSTRKGNDGTIYIYDPAGSLTTGVPNSIITLISPNENYSAGPNFLSYNGKYLYPMSLSVSNYGATNVEFAIMDVTPTGYTDYQGNAWSVQQIINPVIYIVVNAGQSINMDLSASPRFYRGTGVATINSVHVMAKSLTGTGSVAYNLTLIEK